eukprot:4235029-Prymnesium_polylepis.1
MKPASSSSLTNRARVPCKCGPCAAETMLSWPPKSSSCLEYSYSARRAATADAPLANSHGLMSRCTFFRVRTPRT